MKQVVSIGTQDFEKLRDRDAFYVDKTGFIKEWWENEDEVTLITRPRRFGKTLNMSMLEKFFSVEYAGRGALFEGLYIWQEKKYRSLQGSLPVIFLSFAPVKSSTYREARETIIQLIMDLYIKFDFLRQGAKLSNGEKQYFDVVTPDMSDSALAMSLHRLTLCLNRYYEKKALILLDEYDTPLQEAYVHGYWDEMAAFIRRLFNSTFKTNPYMERALMTGITRISKESIFSDLNHLQVVTTTSIKYQTAFGFTEEEVQAALAAFRLSDSMEKIKFWYDGFQFGSTRDIYNPWSITKYLDSGTIENYWANTSEGSLAGKLIREGGPNIKITMEDLLEGKSMEAFIDEEILFSQLDDNDEAIWSLLLACGYLKVDAVLSGSDTQEGKRCRLSLTNYEVRTAFRKTIRSWFTHPSARYNDFVKALLADDREYMNEFMNRISLQTFSSFDTGTHPSEKAEPERFYHGFVLGLMVDLADQYRITSNRESGFGRYDVLMEPLKPGLDAMVLEFKVHQAKEQDLTETVRNALQQIEEKGYDAEFAARGIAKERIRHYGFAFKGKNVLIG